LEVLQNVETRMLWCTPVDMTLDSTQITVGVLGREMAIFYMQNDNGKTTVFNVASKSRESSGARPNTHDSDTIE
jgi:hypothetical protein